jgi:glycerol-3-phosphate dehydrogenase
VTFAELEFSRQREFAPTLLDLRRRCRLAMGVCQGARCIGPAAALLGELQQARDLLDERWKGQRPVLAGDGLAQAELLQATYFGTGALNHAEAAPWR